jgi:hypothetical protein
VLFIGVCFFGERRIIMKIQKLYAKLKPLCSYPEYKDSEVTYIGKFPAHWTLKKIKRKEFSELSPYFTFFRLGFKKLDLEEMYIVVPPYVEQRIIINFIKHLLDRYAKMLSQVHNPVTVAKLEEYLRDCIWDVVTGKVDVRGAI